MPHGVAGPVSGTHVQVVRSSVTGGHRHHEDEIARVLRELGATVTEFQATFPWRRWVGRTTPTDDIYHAVQVARTVRSHDDARSITVFTTVTDALLQPAAVLRRSVVRFDALNRENRKGWRGLVQRALERRVLRIAAVLAPRSVRHMSERSDLTLHPLPSAVVPVASEDPPASTAAPYAFFYGGENVRKKGLDVAVQAWGDAAVAGMELHIAGTEPAAGRRFLAANGVREVPSVRWLGRIDNAEFRRRAAAAAMYVSASRYEEFGVAQIEAFVDAVPVVTVSTDGPVEIVPIMRSIAGDLVAAGQDPATLAVAIRAAAEWDERRRETFRIATEEAAQAYSPAAVREYAGAAVGAAAASAARSAP